MKRLIVFIFLSVLFIPSCEKIAWYYPATDCEADWITNPRYHRTTYYPAPVVNAPESFTAKLNDTTWKAISPHGRYYNNRINVHGSSQGYYLSITFPVNDPAVASIDLTITKYSAYSLKLLEKEVSLQSFDPVSETVNMSFRLKFEVHAYNPVYDGFVTFENGLVRDLKCDRLFCRPDYSLNNETASLYGEWNLIEITDCRKDSTWYPPCGRSASIDIDPTDHGSDAGRTLPYNYDLYTYLTNSGQASYKIVDDTVLVTSLLGATQLGDLDYVMDYERLFFMSLRSDTFTIRKNRNLLELTNRDGVHLRFYR